MSFGTGNSGSHTFPVPVHPVTPMYALGPPFAKHGLVIS
jgi:hypothetical protein